MIGFIFIQEALCCSIAATVGARGNAEPSLEIDNGILAVGFDSVSECFVVRARATGNTFIKEGRLDGKIATAKLVNINDATFGEGEAIEVSYSNGNRAWLMLFPNVPFVLFQVSLYNGSHEITRIKTVRPISIGLNLNKEPAALRAFGTAGLTHPAEHEGSYAYLAIVNPETRNGVVAGWLTHNRGSGVVFSHAKGGMVHLEGQVDYGRLRLAPGKSEESEVFACGYFDDARLGLEAYADAVARVYSIKLPPQPAGYCTWYSDRHGGASDEEHLAELTAFAAEHLKPFGFSFVQIDDKWQEGEQRNGPAKNFTTHKPDGPYPRGMKAAADNIKAHGLTPGIWFMPFAGDHCDPFFKEHPDWFVKREDGEPYETSWGGTSLDITHPEVRDHRRNLVHHLAHEWGYEYFKMDGLWTGTATEQIYINDGYRDDGIGDAVFYNPDKPNIEVYRDGLKLVRETAGKDVFFLGCCASQNMRSFGGSFGLVDAMRVGPDNGSDWSGLLRGIAHGSRKYFLHGRVWYNDPDPVYVRASMPLAHARLICSWVAMSGQLAVNSDWLPGLPPDRFDILKRSIPSHGLLPRPVDLFENDPPRIWLLTDERVSPRRYVLALFNWDVTEVDFDYPLEWIGLPDDGAYVAFDYWQNVLLTPFTGRLQLSVPKESCRILAIRPALDAPQLLSTSRHITQGIVDVLEENWEEEAKVLSGQSRVVAGDVYEMRILASSTKKEWELESVGVSARDRSAKVQITFQQSNGLIRAVIDSPSSREVNWFFRFR